MLTTEEIMEKIEGNMENIKKYGVKRIGLFGSYVRNEVRFKTIYFGECEICRENIKLEIISEIERE